MSVLRPDDSSADSEDIVFLYRYICHFFSIASLQRILFFNPFCGLEKFSFHVLYRMACSTIEVRSFENLFTHPTTTYRIIRQLGLLYDAIILLLSCAKEWLVNLVHFQG